MRYFFKDVVQKIGCKERIYQWLSDRVATVYHQSVDYFDLRTKVSELADIEKIFIYCEDDEMVSFNKGMELYDLHENKHLVQARGFGHYKIISHEEMVRFVVNKSKTEVNQTTLA